PVTAKSNTFGTGRHTPPAILQTRIASLGAQWHFSAQRCRVAPSSAASASLSAADEFEWLRYGRWLRIFAARDARPPLRRCCGPRAGRRLTLGVSDRGQQR